MNDHDREYEIYPVSDPETEIQETGQRDRRYRMESASPRLRRRNEARRRARARKRLIRAAVLGTVFGIFAVAAMAVGSRLLYHGGTADRLPLKATMTVKEPGYDDEVRAVSYEDEWNGSSQEIVAGDKGIVAAVAKACMPSVVAISTVSIQEVPVYYRFYGWGSEQTYQKASSGSGIIVGENDDELLIATNNHVIEGATTITVCFIDGNVTEAGYETVDLLADSSLDIENAVSALIKGTDKDNDLAVVAVKKEDIKSETLQQLRIATLGDSDSLAVGEQVVAIGNALGYGQSVTSGWVSALNRTATFSDGTTAQLIQTDAAINPGNSGGALLNLKGELIGINSAKYADSRVEGMGYAIPISKAYPILEELMSRETRVNRTGMDSAYLGVTLADISREAFLMYDIPSGAFVAEAVSGQPAEAAGIRKGDIIEELDGRSITNGTDLYEALQYYSPDEVVDIVVARSENGSYKEQKITVTLGRRSDNT